MKSLFLLPVIILLVACGNKNLNAPDLVLKFGTDHLEPLLNEEESKTLIVVLNPSECGSCEAEITNFVNLLYPKFKSITLLPKDVKISAEIKRNKTILINRQKLDQHGLLNANGSILIYKGKNCIYFSPIDILNTDKMKDTIFSLNKI